MSKAGDLVEYSVADAAMKPVKRKKLTLKQLAEMRMGRKQGLSYGQLAYIFHVSRQFAFRVTHRVSQCDDFSTGCKIVENSA